MFPQSAYINALNISDNTLGLFKCIKIYIYRLEINTYGAVVMIVRALIISVGNPIKSLEITFIFSLCIADILNIFYLI